MAKSILQQFKIEVGQAVSALKNVTRSTQIYNAELKQSHQLQAQLNQQSAALRNQFTALTRGINSASGGFRTLNTSANAATKSLIGTSNSLKDLHKTLVFTATVGVATLVHRGFNALINGCRDSIAAAQELQTRIGEIQTVSLKLNGTILETAKNANVWSREMLALSASLGIPVVEQAEAVYQALSNQVIVAGEAARFMGSEMKLAVTAVSSLNQATEVTSTVINAYAKSSTDAERINATLFGLIDVGRVRLDELTSSFGRAAVLSHTLGVTFEEQAGALALLTRLGLDADVANTLLVNVFNSLIKPSKEMTAVLQKWGVNSGEAAIATFGFAGVMKKFAEEIESSNGELTEIAKLFEDLRAITGAAGLVRNIDGLTSSIDRVTDATKKYDAAFQATMEGLGRRGTIQLEKFKQFFLQTFGLPAQRLMVEWSEGAGGVDRILGTIFNSLRGLLILWGSFTATGLIRGKRDLSSISLAWRQYNDSINANIAAQKAAQKASTLTQTAKADQDKLIYLRNLMVANRQHSGILINTTLLQQQANKATASHAAAANAARLAIDAQANATRVAAGATAALAIQEAAVTLGITLIIAAVADMIIANQQWEANIRSLVAELEGLELERARKDFEAFGKVLDEQDSKFRDIINNTAKNYAVQVSKIQQLNNLLLVDIEDKYGKMQKAMALAFKGASDTISDNITALKKALSEAERASEKVADSIKKLKSDSRDRALDDRISGAPGGVAAGLIEKERIRIHAEALEAVAAGDEELALSLFDKFDKLGEKMVDMLRKAKAEAIKVAEEAKDTIKKGDLTVGSGGFSGRVDDVRFRIPVSVRRRLGLPSISKKISLEDPVAGTRDDIAKPARAEAKRIDEELLRLARERTIEEGKRLELLERIKALKDEEVAKAKADVKAAEDAQEKFRATLAELDAFKPDKKGGIPEEASVAEFDRLLKEALTSGKAAGLSGADVTSLLRDANKLRVELNRAAEATITRDSAAELAKRIEATKQAMLKANEERNELQKKANEAVGGAKGKSRAFGAEIDALFSTLLPGNEVDGKRDLAGAEQAFINIKKVLADISKIEEQIAATQKAGGLADPKAVSALAAKYEELVGLLDKVEEKGATRTNGFGAPEGSRDKAGRLLLPSDKTVTLSEAAAERLAQIKEANIALAKAEEARSKNLLKNNADIQIQLEQLQAAYNKLAVEIEGAGDLSIAKQKELNALLFEQLEAIKLIQEQMKLGGEAGGAPVGPGAAGGRVGIDSMLTPTAFGESVMTRLATRQYAPMLRMMNGDVPRFNNGGSSTNMNFGDINVMLPQGSTSMQATELASKLTRLRRQGRWN
jgi:TP901 family phage tail tape measure protein